MKPHLNFTLLTKKSDKSVGIGIAAKKTALEKEQTGSPDRRAPAIPRKNVAGDDRLHLKEKKSAQENDCSEDRHVC